ncbi:MAG: carbonic anhydrase [Treponema sp.]|nr:carbonic anhydrase [Treponema sp.]
MTYNEAFNHLTEGNARFTAGKPRQTHVTAELRENLFKNGQFPYAAIVCCSDSRAPVELIFDAGPGELFVVRTAGNIVGPTQLGSLEFAVTVLKAPLVVVMGHQACGAVIAATTNGEFSPALGSVIQEIRCCAPNVIGSDPDVIIDENVKYALSKIAENPFISKAAAEGSVKLAGAKYSLETGIVTFFD